MSSPYAVHPMEAAFRAWEIERAAHDRKIAELWKSVQGERHDDALDYFRRGFFLGSNYQKDQLVSEASPLGHAAKEAECVAKCLDDAGTPKADGGEELSLWGRVVRYAATLAAAPLLPACDQKTSQNEQQAGLLCMGERQAAPSGEAAGQGAGTGFHDPERLKAWDAAGREIALQDEGLLMPRQSAVAQEPDKLPPLPVGWIVQMTPDPEGTPAELFFKEDMIGYAKLAVARAAPRVLPLTEERIEEIWKAHVLPGIHDRQKFYSPHVFAREIEAAHGIQSPGISPKGDGTQNTGKQ